MRTVFIIAAIVALAGCSKDSGGTVRTPRAHADSPITREQAIAIARDAHNMDYDRSGEIVADLTNGQYVVTFPVKKPVPQPGTRWSGPDYAARIWIDAKTGKVLQARVGS